MSDDDTYYDELGVDPNASRDELKAAYQERISELEAARGGKGVTDAQLQRNREEVARVRAAWNVLADPFQRNRYDATLDTASSNGDSGVEVVGVDDAADDESSEEPKVQLTGWRRLMAPPPPKQAKPAAGNGKQPPPRRPVREPTIQLPPGMRFAEPKARGMALLEKLWSSLAEIDGLTLYGPKPGTPRTPTLSFTLRGIKTDDIAIALAKRGVFVSNGDFYAATIVERLGLVPDGLLRVGCSCYTTEDEVDRLIEGVRAVASGRT
jgi:curved DNA-binding protein CbpA